MAAELSIVVVGLSYRVVPLALLERVTVAPADLPKALHDLSSGEHLSEAVLLSTCHRTEVYASFTKFHPSVRELREFLCRLSASPPEDLVDHLYCYHDEMAVAHLFRVAAGLDSVVLGESEILGQVREAWVSAKDEGTSGPVLDRVLRHALQVGRRARSDTGIGRGAVSVPAAAVALAVERLGSLAGRSVLLIGAGTVGEGLVRGLASCGADEVVVANRSPERGAALAARAGGVAVGLDRVGDALRRADVVFSSTGTPGILVGRDDIEAAMAHRAGRPLMLVDVALPRDLDPGARELPGVTLLDLDDLKAFAQRSLDRRGGEVERVERIVAGELERLALERDVRETTPLVTQLRARGEEIRQGELERFAGALDGLGPRERETVEALTRGIVNKLLHEPTVRAKELSRDGIDHAEALAALFGLEFLRGGGEMSSKGG